MSYEAAVTTLAGRLRVAWANARANGGSAGTDGVTLGGPRLGAPSAAAGEQGG